jgi:hypothetical protein
VIPREDELTSCRGLFGCFYCAEVLKAFCIGKCGDHFSQLGSYHPGALRTSIVASAWFCVALLELTSSALMKTCSYLAGSELS